MYYLKDYLLVIFIVGFISACITGFIADVVASKKNQKGFWWRVFLILDWDYSCRLYAC